MRIAALALLLLAAPAWGEALPQDGGIVDVRDFGARGNGTDDDTAALLAAIAASGGDTGRSFWHDRIVYLPDGTYRVSGTLLKRYANGGFASGLMLMGQSRDGTIIRLADHAPGFDDPRAPKPVVFTTSKLLDGGPTGGGKDYAARGEGNDAYMNFVEDLTVDVGDGNPGAVALDYLANNVGTVRNVLLRAGSGSGMVGLSMIRKWPGPALIEHLTVRGFETGIDVAQTEYGLTFDHVRLENQRGVALRDSDNALAIRDLVIEGTATPLTVTAAKGFVAIDGGKLAGAIDNRGTIVARNIASLASTTAPDWAPRLVDPPPVPHPPPERWANVQRFSAVADPAADSTEGLRRAFASGASIIYLPNGIYSIAESVDVPPSVERIVGMNSTLKVLPRRSPGFARTSGMLRVASGGKPLAIDRLAFDNTDMGQQLALELSGAREIIVRDVVAAGVTLLDRKATGGRLFIENVCCGRLRVAGPAPVVARQLDTEGAGVRIENVGAPLAILGLKTEGIATILDNRAGGHADIFGGLVYMVRDPSGDPVPAFRNADSWLAAAFAEESLRPTSRYRLYLAGVPAANFPERGFGRVVPNLVATPERAPGQ